MQTTPNALLPPDSWLCQAVIPLQAVDWHSAPAQKHKRASMRAQRQMRKEEAEQAAWLRAQARQAYQAEEAERQAHLQRER